VVVMGRLRARKQAPSAYNAGQVCTPTLQGAAAVKPR
jgi:hypothetical protein